jgi:hypothetical protein
MDLNFGATVIGLNGGEKTVARITFVNGAVKMAIIDGDKGSWLGVGVFKPL